MQSALTVANQFDGQSAPRAGCSLSVGRSGFGVASEANLRFCLAALKSGIENNLFALSARNENKGGAKPHVIVKIEVEAILVSKALINGVEIVEVLTILGKIKFSMINLFVEGKSGGANEYLIGVLPSLREGGR